MLKHNFKKQLLSGSQWWRTPLISAIGIKCPNPEWLTPPRYLSLNLLRAQFFKTTIPKTLVQQAIPKWLYLPPPMGFLYISLDCVSHCISDWPRTLLPLPRVPLGLNEWATTTHGPYFFDGPVRWGKVFQDWHLGSIHSESTWSCPDLSTLVEANTRIHAINFKILLLRLFLVKKKKLTDEEKRNMRQVGLLLTEAKWWLFWFRVWLLELTLQKEILQK